jgi:hypothetical protein
MELIQISFYVTLNNVCVPTVFVLLRLGFHVNVIWIFLADLSCLFGHLVLDINRIDNTDKLYWLLIGTLVFACLLIVRRRIFFLFPDSLFFYFFSFDIGAVILHFIYLWNKL